MPALDLQKIARLARLELSAAEIAVFTPQMERILGMMTELDALEIEGAAPFRPGADSLAARADEPGRCLPPAGALRNAPSKEGALFTVPRAAPKKGGPGAGAGETSRAKK